MLKRPDPFPCLFHLAKVLINKMNYSIDNLNVRCYYFVEFSLRLPKTIENQWDVLVRVSQQCKSLQQYCHSLVK